MFRRKSLLLVDFDNVVSLLGREFTGHIPAWTDWLASGKFEAKPRKRNLVRKLVYWGGTNDLFRAEFEAAGFIAHACPAEAKNKSTTSDMHIAMDAMEWGLRKGRIDEIILLSTDTDFAPLVRRLTTMGISSVVLVNKSNRSAVVYRNCAATVIEVGAMREVYAGTEPALVFKPASVIGPPPEQPPKPPNGVGKHARVKPAMLIEARDFDLDDAARRAVAMASAAVEGAPIGKKAVVSALRTIPGFSTTGRQPWLGCGSYVQMLQELATRTTDLTVKIDANGGAALFYRAPPPQER